MPQSDPYAGRVCTSSSPVRAGFIGSNFVRHWVNEHPGDGVVALDLLTYAGNRDNLADVDDRITFVEGDIGDLDLVAAVLERETIDVIVNFAAESHNSLAVLDPGRFLRTNVLGTQTLLEAARDRGVARFHHVSTCEVYGDLALDDPGRVHRGLALPAAHAVQRVEGGGRPRRARVPRDLRAADHDLELLEQLRAVPVPGEGGPVLHHARARRQAAPALRVDRHKREWLHVLDHCRAIEQIVLHGPRRRDLQRRERREASIDEIADLVLDTLGKPDVAEDDRARPPRPRSPVPARRHEDPRASSGGRPQVEFDAGHPRHGRVVRREPRLVGAAARPRPGGGDGLERRSRLRAVAPVRILVTGAGGQVGARVVGAPRRPRRPRAPRTTSLDLADREQVEQVVGDVRAPTRW